MNIQIDIEELQAVVDAIGPRVSAENDEASPLWRAERVLDAALLAYPSSYESQQEDAMHERHVDLMAHCRLCRIEAGAQTDRLVVEDD